MYKVGELNDRYELANLCNFHGLNGWAVEIGTDRGYFASEFLKRWHGHSLYCVDPYEDNMVGYDDDIRWPREPDMLMAIQVLAPYTPRARMVRLTSEKAVSALRHFLPHFVYIDGNHDYQYVKQDIELWWPRLRNGGIIAGHDFCEHTPGVMQAVHEFFDPKSVKVLLTAEADYPSWYTFKP